MRIAPWSWPCWPRRGRRGVDVGEERGFPGAVRADDGDGFAVGDGEVDGVERGAFLLGVGEGDVAELDGSGVACELGEARAVAGLGGHREEFGEALGGGGGLDVVDDSGQGFEGGGGEAEHAEGHDERGGFELVVEDGFDGDERQRADDEEREGFDERACEGAARCGRGSARA